MGQLDVLLQKSTKTNNSTLKASSGGNLDSLLSTNKGKITVSAPKKTVTKTNVTVTPKKTDLVSRTKTTTDTLVSQSKVIADKTKQNAKPILNEAKKMAINTAKDVGFALVAPLKEIPASVKSRNDPRWKKLEDERKKLDKAEVVLRKNYDAYDKKTNTYNKEVLKAWDNLDKKREEIERKSQEINAEYGGFTSEQANRAQKGSEFAFGLTTASGGAYAGAVSGNVGFIIRQSKNNVTNKILKRLPEGEVEVNKVVQAVIDTGTQNTKEGKAIIKGALDAKSEGKKVEIVSADDLGFVEKDVAKELKNKNKPTNQRLTEQTKEATLKGEREAERLTNEDKLITAKKYNKLADDTTQESTVKVYRVTTGDELKTGDYLSFNKANVEAKYLKNREGAKVIEQEVKVKDLVNSGGTKDEFIYAPEAPKPIYHGTPEKFTKFDTNRSEGGATWFTADKGEILSGKAGAVQKAGQKLNVMERYIKPNIKLATPEQADNLFTDQLIAEGYRGVRYPASKESAEWTKLWFPNEDTVTKPISNKVKTVKPKPKEIVSERTIKTETIKKPSYTSKEARTVQESFSNDIQRITHNTSSESELIEKTNKLYDETLPKVQGDRSALAGLRTSLNKEMFEFAGISGGNFKANYAELKTLMNSPDIGKYLSNLEKKVQEIDNLILKTPEKTKVITKKSEKIITTKEIPKPIGKGETKQSGLAVGVEAKAIEKKLADNLGDLPEYKQVNMKDQANKAGALLTKDEQKAIDIALGKKAPPADILPESVFIAVENKAIREGNIDLLRQLANSVRTTEATAMGQRIRTLAERYKDSPVKILSDIMDQREEAFKLRYKGRSSEEVKKKIVSDIQNKVKKPNKNDWSSFVESIKC